ncbi:MAG: hypothetical protein LC637_07335, partial [Xanthomonadaceae bacterium]|nr:hypothetical protein [Xanthomonadaceae bacterium]
MVILAGACPRWNERKLQVLARMLQAVCDSLFRLMESSFILLRGRVENCLPERLGLIAAEKPQP